MGHWKQNRNVIIGQMGKTKGSCLKNTRVAASPDIPSKYATAHDAMTHSTVHSGTPPKGVWVPAFFDFWATIEGVYKNWGHVGWVSPTGLFYSDGVKYSSISAYDKAHAPVYRGWGETLNGVRVVSYVADPKPPAVPSSGTLHLDKGTITTTFDHNGRKVGSIYARDNTYDYKIRGRNGNRVIVNSASGGGNGVEIAILYLDGGVIPGRHVK